LLYTVNMSTFLSEAIDRSGKSQADIARALGKSPQALYSLITYPTPKAESIAQVLHACGWSTEEILSLRFGEVYDLAFPAAPDG